MALFNFSRTLLIFGLVALCFQSAYAHTYLSSVFLNNQLLNEGDCVRPHPRGGFDSPIPLVTSREMTCGWLPEANNPANRKCPIAAGSKIGIQWHHTSNSPSDDIIDSTHVGPIIFYLAKSDSGAGDVWFKIYEDGFANGKWAVDRLLANRGRVDFTIPSDIAPGNYLLRGELIALHGAYAVNGVQPYVGCVELTITGSGNANPSGVSFPGYYKNTDPGMLMSVYQPFSKYIIPGPALYVSGSSSSSSTTGSPSNPTSAPPSTAPTQRPTTTPTNPTTTPYPTYTPTYAPTGTPAVGNIKVGLLGGTNEWWVEVAVQSGGAETTVKVEIMDSGNQKTWASLRDLSYAFVFEAPNAVQAPISLRLTSSNGKVVVLNNVFTSLSTNGLIDSGKSYSGSSTPAPTQPATPAPTQPATPAPTQPATPAPTQPATPAPTQPATPAPTQPATPAPTQPATQAPTQPATQAPTNPPSSGSAKVKVYESASQWWFALTVSGVDAAKVEIKDAGKVSSYVAMEKFTWGPQEVYTYTAQGSALSAPISVRITSKSGNVEIVSVTRIAPNAVFEASS